MLTGEVAALRARHDSDIPVLEAELYDDVAMRSRSDARPWRPIPPGSAASPFRVTDPREDPAAFSVVELASEELAGAAVLWGVDTHSRMAHIGLSLRPSFRGRGLGVDTVRLLCRYGFEVRGMHRLQVDTLADNDAMIRAATRAGFTREGTLRQASWVTGAFADEVILGQLISEWLG
jgi:RimJ/RimL family protein N-acetyltransferase